VFEALRRLDADLAGAEEAIAALRPVVQSLHERLPGALRYAAVVAYDATGDLAGNLSRSIALLNERGDGLVLTLLTRRSESLFYTKMVRAGRGQSPSRLRSRRRSPGRWASSRRAGAGAGVPALP